MNPNRPNIWLKHTLICVAVTIPFALFGYGEQAATVMAVFYVLRETYQGLTKGFQWAQIGDAAGPVLVALVAWGLR